MGVSTTQMRDFLQVSTALRVARAVLLEGDGRDRGTWGGERGRPFAQLLRARLADAVRAAFENIGHGVSEAPHERLAAAVAALWMALPAAVRWISAEPLLGPITVFDLDGPVDVREGMDPGLHWVVGGGESGPDARRSGASRPSIPIEG